MPSTLVRRWSSTTTRPRSVRTPTSSSPSPSTQGTRPVATSTTWAGRAWDSPPWLKRTSSFPAEPVMASTLASVWTVPPLRSKWRR